MATIFANGRSSRQHVNQNIKVGSLKRKKYLTSCEVTNIRKAISSLSRACETTKESATLVELMSAYQTLRTIILSIKN